MGFYNPKDLDASGCMSDKIIDIKKERLPGDVLPASSHCLTLFCYLRTEGTCPPMPGEDDEMPSTWRQAPDPNPNPKPNPNPTQVTMARVLRRGGRLLRRPSPI